jgi:hypothetical protein
MDAPPTERDGYNLHSYGLPNSAHPYRYSRNQRVLDVTTVSSVFDNLGVS